MKRRDVARVLTLDDNTPNEQLERVLKALDSLNRIRILRFLSERSASVSELAAALDIPTSTAALHVETLEDSGLLRTELEPANRGLQKICYRTHDRIIMDLPVKDRP